MSDSATRLFRSALVVLTLSLAGACGGDNGATDPDPDPDPGDGNIDPVALFDLETAGTSAPVGIAVDGTASSDADGEIVSWSWNFGDGSSATGPTATHLFDAAGSYEVTLTVTDDGGAGATSSRTVSVAAIASDRIGGVVWFDRNGDGVRQADDDGLPGQTVFLDGDGDGELGAGEATAVSGVAGVYEFTGLAAGDYAVTQRLGLGWTNTAPGSGGVSSSRPSVGWPAGRGPARILQGDDAPDDFPFMASIQIAEEPDPQQAHICGGTLVAPAWVLTASHCLSDNTGQPFAADFIEVLLGTHRLDGSGFRVEVAEIVLNPGYSPAGGFYKRDVSLVRLATRAEEDRARVFLMDPETFEAEVSPGDLGTVIGWGRTGDAAPIPVPLQIAQIPLRPNQDCVSSWNQDEVQRFDDTMLCVGHRGGTPDTCSGDSGGPWMIDIGGRFRQAGAVSWGPVPCGRPTIPSAFASIPAMFAFLEEHIRPEPSGAVAVTVGTAGARVDFGNFH